MNCDLCSAALGSCPALGFALTRARALASTPVTGEAGSVKYFYSLGHDYVSCSPFRVPIARLAAAQAATAEAAP